MKTNLNKPFLIAISLSCLGAWCAPSARADAPALNEIPTLDGDTSNEGRAITRDGQYVVGLSGTRGYLYPVGSATAILVLSSDNAAATVANGVGYRTALDPIYATNRTELIISGMSSGWATEWMTPDGGTSFGPKRRNTSVAQSVAMGVANQVGSSIGSDAYYVSSFKNVEGDPVYVNQGAGAWLVTMTYTSKGITKPDKSAMNGLAASGRAVGWRGVGTSTAKNYMLTYNGTGTPTPAFFNGLAGDNWGTAFAVSADGNSVFGQSPIAAGNVGAKYAYKTTFTGANGTNGTTQGAVNRLPLFGDETGSTSMQVAYSCTADGNYGVGMDYRGQERAVLWDASSANTNLWTILDLTDLARNNGFLGDFTLNLRRAYAAGTNGAGDIVVTGFGVLSSATSRAFLITVPKWIAAIGFPGNQTVNYGSNVSIVLKTNGTDSLTYQWYKDGNELSGQTTTALSINNVSCAGGQAGVYSVVVSNAPISAVVTGAMTLTVLDPYFLAQPSNQTNFDGTIATFTVSADGAPTLSYKWQRGGADLVDGDTGWGSTIYGATTPTLMISNVQPFDATSGDYTGIVTTSAGGCSATSRAVTLKVLVRPVLSTYVDPTGGNYTLYFDGPFNQNYEIRYSTDVKLPLSSWPVLTTGTLLGPASYTDIAPADPQRFYIIKIVYP